MTLWGLTASMTQAQTANSLMQKYEINLGYPMPRATFMGGVSLNF